MLKSIKTANEDRENKIDRAIFRHLKTLPRGVREVSLDRTRANGRDIIHIYFRHEGVEKHNVVDV